MKWTDDQQKVIDLRDRNILVSAAAGSGKTAVLVERIITMITEGENPIDIDQLLIVTFTNAAAAEMRERIGAAIERKLSEDSDNLHLQNQMTLIHSAQITTIHSFCLYIIRNHFHTIDLDPSFRIGDEAELKLIQSDVIEELLEKHYEEAEEEFLIFTESYASGKTDALIEELILSLYGFSMSYPYPKDWLNEIRDSFSIDSLEAMGASLWMKSLLEYMRTMIKDIYRNNEEALSIANESSGPYPYVPALEDDRDMLEGLLRSSSYHEYGIILNNIKWTRLSSKRDENIDEEKKSKVKSLRESIKKGINDLSKNYFFQSEEEMLKDIMGTKVTMNVLIDITIEYAEEYEKKKREKNLVDFNDLEHFALDILVKEGEIGTDDYEIAGILESKKLVATPVAVDLSEHYKEILVDEYQDSNLVQETIINSISKEKYGQPNIFMVGDVKQSIYKFRLARPELFMSKYKAYSLEDGIKQRIDLHKNFRSRRVVLESINFIFEQIMREKLGGIEYDEKAALYVGADYDEKTEGISLSSELLLIDIEGDIADQDENDDMNDDSMGELTQKELEARAIALSIKELTDPNTGLMIVDKEKSKDDQTVYRRATNKDIVILLRTMTGWSDVFVDTLMSEGIPAYSDTQSGYFKTLEIKTILNLLTIVDNPRQDIPLVAVLHSPIVGLSSNELAIIRATYRNLDIYDCIVLYVNEESDNDDSRNLPIDSELKIKISNFLIQLENYRNMVSYTPIHQFIEYVLDDTGYYNYISAMPGGERRTANVDMLIQKAISFESTSYTGLFQFNRYIEKLHKYEIDYGEATVSNGEDHSVRIMSIHKSKGLEFPVVYVAGLGKQFNLSDARSKIVIHPDLGLGPDYIDYTLRMKSPTLIKKLIQRQTVLENLGEELRVLYVALTRAKEKLILTGSVRSLKKSLEKWKDINYQTKIPHSFQTLTSANSFLDWVIPSLIRHQSFDTVLEDYEFTVDFDNPLHNKNVPWEVSIINTSELSMVEVSNQIKKRFDKTELLQWDSEKVYDQNIRDEIEKRLNYEYPYVASVKIPAKMTVSELKKLGQMEEYEQESAIPSITKEDSIIPKFICKEKPMKSSDRGTLYHKVLECMNLLHVHTKEDIIVEMERLVAEHMIGSEEANGISIPKLEKFIQSDIAKRMRVAIEKGKLKKEQQFVLGVPANTINELVNTEELVLIQGIIDVYFEDEDGIVLLDYKTDYIPEGENDSFLVNRYKVQLDYYQKAIEQMLNKRVKEKVIYSFGLEKEISFI